MTTCAVVVTYNRIELLQKCLDALLGQSCKLDNVYVIDNGSTDGTRSYLAAREDELAVIFSETNGGGAGGFSQGIARALSDGCDYIWVMDDDAEPTLDAHQALQTATELLGDREFSFLASTVTDFTGQLVATHVSPSGRTLSDIGCSQIEFSSFVGTYISADYARRTFLPVADFFIHHDDLEYTSRLSTMAPGYRVDSSRIMHPDKVSSGDFGARLEHELRNRIWISRKKLLANKKVRREFARNLIRHTLVHGKVSKDKKVFFRAASRAWIQGVFTSPKLIAAPVSFSEDSKS